MNKTLALRKKMRIIDFVVWGTAKAVDFFQGESHTCPTCREKSTAFFYLNLKVNKMNLFTPPKRVKRPTPGYGIDSNLFFLLGYFCKQARKDGWSEDEIMLVLSQWEHGDYVEMERVLDDHLE